MKSLTGIEFRYTSGFWVYLFHMDYAPALTALGLSREQEFVATASVNPMSTSQLTYTYNLILVMRIGVFVLHTSKLTYKFIS